MEVLRTLKPGADQVVILLLMDMPSICVQKVYLEVQPTSGKYLDRQTTLSKGKFTNHNLWVAIVNQSGWCEVQVDYNHGDKWETGVSPLTMVISDLPTY